MMVEPRTGNGLTSNSPEAVRLYQDAVDLILGSESGAAQMLDDALGLDRDFAVAAAARYYVAQDIGESNSDIYRELAENASKSVTDWEQEHVNILIGLIDHPGDSQGVAMRYIESSPADLLVISQITGNLFFYGGPMKLESVLNVLESVEHALGDDWAFLARLGFAASEAGQHRRGRRLLEKSLERRPQSLYTIHGLAHMLHDEGAAEESAQMLRDWLSSYEMGAREGQMYGHVQWHLALSEWQIGDHDTAMKRYLEYCAPATTTCGPILTLADCGGFLLREYLRHGQTKDIGDEVTQHIEAVWGMMGHPFVVLHVAALYASAGDLDGLDRCEEVVSDTANGVARETSLSLISALRDLVRGDTKTASQTLVAITPEARIGIGGSNVERILVDLIEARCNALH